MIMKLLDDHITHRRLPRCRSPRNSYPIFQKKKTIITHHNKNPRTEESKFILQKNPIVANPQKSKWDSQNGIFSNQASKGNEYTTEKGDRDCIRKKERGRAWLGFKEGRKVPMTKGCLGESSSSGIETEEGGAEREVGERNPEKWAPDAASIKSTAAPVLLMLLMFFFIIFFFCFFLLFFSCSSSSSADQSQRSFCGDRDFPTLFPSTPFASYTRVVYIYMEIDGWMDQQNQQHWELTVIIKAVNGGSHFD